MIAIKRRTNLLPENKKLTIRGWAEKFHQANYDAMVEFDQMWLFFNIVFPQCGPYKSSSIGVAALGFPSLPLVL